MAKKSQAQNIAGNFGGGSGKPSAMGKLTGVMYGVGNKIKTLGKSIDTLNTSVNDLDKSINNLSRTIQSNPNSVPSSPQNRPSSTIPPAPSPTNNPIANPNKFLNFVSNTWGAIKNGLVGVGNTFNRYIASPMKDWISNMRDKFSNFFNNITNLYAFRQAMNFMQDKFGEATKIINEHKKNYYLANDITRAEASGRIMGGMGARKGVYSNMDRYGAMLNGVINDFGMKTGVDEYLDKKLDIKIEPGQMSKEQFAQFGADILGPNGELNMSIKDLTYTLIDRNLLAEEEIGQFIEFRETERVTDQQLLGIYNNIEALRRNKYFDPKLYSQAVEEMSLVTSHLNGEALADMQKKLGKTVTKWNTAFLKVDDMLEKLKSMNTVGAEEYEQQQNQALLMNMLGRGDLGNKAFEAYRSGDTDKQGEALMNIGKVLADKYTQIMSLSTKEQQVAEMEIFKSMLEGTGWSIQDIQEIKRKGADKFIDDAKTDVDENTKNDTTIFNARKVEHTIGEIAEQTLSNSGIFQTIASIMENIGLDFDDLLGFLMLGKFTLSITTGIAKIGWGLFSGVAGLITKPLWWIVKSIGGQAVSGIGKLGAMAGLGSVTTGLAVGGIAKTGYDAYKGYKQSEEMGVDLGYGIVGGTLAGAKDGGTKNALINSTKYASIGLALGGPVGAAIGGVVGAFTGYIGSEKLSKYMQKAGDWIKNKTMEYWETAKLTWGTIADGANWGWETLKNIGNGVWESIKLYAESVWDIVSFIPKTMYNFVSEKVKGLWGWLKDGWEALKGGPSKVWDFMKGTFDSAVDWAGSFFTSMGETIKNFFSLDYWKGKISEKWQGVKDWWNGKESQAKTISTDFKNTQSKINSEFDKKFQSRMDAYTGGLNSIQQNQANAEAERLRKQQEKIAEIEKEKDLREQEGFLKYYGNQALEMGKDILNKSETGQKIVEMSSSLLDKGSDFFRAISEIAKASLDGSNGIIAELKNLGSYLLDYLRTGTVTQKINTGNGTSVTMGVNPNTMETGLAKGKFTNDPKKNANAVAFMKIAEPIARQMGIAPELLFAQWALESDYGSKNTGDYNYFGIKADANWKKNGGAYKNVLTQEVVNGKKGYYYKDFRSYKSAEEGIRDYVRLIATKYNGGDLNKIFSMYATDGAYGQVMGKLLAQGRNGLGLDTKFPTTNSPEIGGAGITLTGLNKQVNEAADFATGNAYKQSLGKCAKFVNDALIKSGIKLQRGHAYQMPENLKKAGFVSQPVTNSTKFRKGDIVTFGRNPNKKIEYGHIQIFNGSNWVSDFGQKSYLPGKKYTGESGLLWRPAGSTDDMVAPVPESNTITTDNIQTVKDTSVQTNPNVEISGSQSGDTKVSINSGLDTSKLEAKLDRNNLLMEMLIRIVSKNGGGVNLGDMGMY